MGIIGCGFRGFRLVGYGLALLFFLLPAGFRSLRSIEDEILWAHRTVHMASGGLGVG